jgi:2,3-bisphosphoglycerate-dependent phosphoglycerate mutase
VRHGETAWNAEGRLQGQLDVPLSDVGRAQARAVATWFAAEAARLASGRVGTAPPATAQVGANGDAPASTTAATAAAVASPPRKIRAVYASDLARAAETAHFIAAALGTPPPFLDARFRETCLGGFEGSMWGSLDEGAMRAWKRDLDAPAPGGGTESLRARFSRVTAALTAVALAHVDEAVVVVGHGGMLDDIARLLLARPFGGATGLRRVNTCVAVAAFEPAEAARAAARAALSALGPDAQSSSEVANVPAPFPGT